MHPKKLLVQMIWLTNILTLIIGFIAGYKWKLNTNTHNQNKPLKTPLKPQIRPIPRDMRGDIIEPIIDIDDLI